MPDAGAATTAGAASPRVAVVGNQWETAFRFRGPLIEALLQRGLTVDVIGPEQEDGFRHRVETIGARTHGIPINRAGTNPVREFATIVALARLLRRLRPEFTFAYFAKPVIYTSFAAVLARVPRRYALIAGLGHAFSGDDSGSMPDRRVLTAALRSLFRLSLGLNRKVFFQNPDDRRLFVETRLVHAGSAVQVNGTGVDLAEYAYHDPVTAPVTFVLAARLIAEKGLREYAAAARSLRERGWQLRCVLLGGLDDNPSALTEQELTSWVDEGVLEWHGAVADVRPWLRDSSVYVLPSYYREGVPRSIQEAMAVGRAVITTDSPGCRETVDQGQNGILVSPRDTTALVQAMERYLREPERIVREGRASRKLAEERFDVHRINRFMLEQMDLAGDSRRR